MKDVHEYSVRRGERNQESECGDRGGPFRSVAVFRPQPMVGKSEEPKLSFDRPETIDSMLTPDSICDLVWVRGKPLSSLQVHSVPGILSAAANVVSPLVAPFLPAYDVPIVVLGCPVGPHANRIRFHGLMRLLVRGGVVRGGPVSQDAGKWSRQGSETFSKGSKL